MRWLARRTCPCKATSRTDALTSQPDCDWRRPRRYDTPATRVNERPTSATPTDGDHPSPCCHLSPVQPQWDRTSATRRRFGEPPESNPLRQRFSKTCPFSRGVLTACASAAAKRAQLAKRSAGCAGYSAVLGWCCSRFCSHRLKDAALSVDFLPNNNPSTPISSSRSGQWMP